MYKRDYNKKYGRAYASTSVREGAWQTIIGAELEFNLKRP